MISSDDSDIILRKKQKRMTRDIESDEDISDSEYSDSQQMEGDFGPVFLEIFGKGDEYQEYDSVPDTEKPHSIPEVTPEECHKYVRRNLLAFTGTFQCLNTSLIQRLLDGYSPEYISFHLGIGKLNELYYIMQLIEDYKKFYATGKHTFDSLRALQSHKKQDPLCLPGLISIDEYMENLLLLERMNVPKGSINFQFDSSNYRTISESDRRYISSCFSKPINQIATNSMFVDKVSLHREAALLEGSNHRSNSVYSLLFLQNLYVSDSMDFEDEIRKCIIHEAFDMAVRTINETRVRDSFSRFGLGDWPSPLAELVSMVVSLKSRSKSTASIYFHSNVFYCVKLSENGEISSSKIFKNFELQELHSFFKSFDSVLLTSSSQSVKFLFQNLQLNLLYVPSKISFFDDMKEFSVPYNIALAVQCPVIYFSKLLLYLQKGYKVVSPFVTDISILEKTIKIACASHPVDLTYAIKHVFGYALFHLLGISLDVKYFDYERLPTLESLRDIYSEAEFSNICTFFNLTDSKIALDRSFVHPNLYSTAYVLLKSYYHRLLIEKNALVTQAAQFIIETDYEAISDLFVSNPSYLKITAPPISQGPTYDLVWGILQRDSEIYFTGATDAQIFDDVVAKLDYKVYSASILHVGPTFYICNVQGTSVFVRKEGEYSLNQIVEVDIQDRTNFMLNYSGSIVEAERVSLDTFRIHPLFKNLNHCELEDFMKNSGHTILIRPSSTSSFCVVVCKILNSIFYSFKIHESVDQNDHTTVFYTYLDRKYPSLNHFIQEYISKMYFIMDEILKHKYFYSSPEDGTRYMDTAGEFTKYCMFFSKNHPGMLEVLIQDKKLMVKIDGEYLYSCKQRFGSIYDLISYIKGASRNMY